MTTSLLRYQPFTELRRAVDSLFDERFFTPYQLFSPGQNKVTPIDIYHNNKEMVIKASMPGVKPEEVDISITDNILTIKGENKAEEKIERKDCLYQEHRYGTFCRSVTLPRGLKTNKAEANFEDGILILTLPKAEETKPKQIKVKAKPKSTASDKK